MKVKQIFHVELSVEEARALRTLLGTFSDVTKQKHGLDPDMSSAMTELYDELADSENEESES